jgi:hypothetical protein
MARLNEKVKRVNLEQTPVNATFFDPLSVFRGQNSCAQASLEP